MQNRMASEWLGALWILLNPRATVAMSANINSENGFLKLFIL